MKQFFVRLWRCFRFPLIVALGSLPLVLILTAYFMPSFLPFVWAIPAGYVILDGLSTRIPGKWRRIYGLAELILTGLLGWYIYRNTQDMIAMLIPVLLMVMFLQGIIFPSKKRNEGLHFLWYVLGIGIHLLGQVLIYSAGVLENPVLDPITPWTRIGFFLLAVVCMLTMNEANLAAATSGRQQISKLMQRKNILMTLVLFGIALLISCVPAIVSGAGAALRWILMGIFWLIHWLTGDGAGTGSENIEQAPTQAPGVLDPGETSTTPEWLSAILTGIMLVFVAAVILFALYLLTKKIIVFVKYLIRMLENYMHSVSEDYIDEISDTRTDDDDTSQRSRGKRKLSAEEVRKLSPEQRIRYRFQRLLQKHPEWDSGATAREKLPPEAAPLYEQVRYGGRTATEAEAQKFATDTKKL